MTATTAPPAKRGFPFGRLIKDARYAMLLNVLCALVITAIVGDPGDFLPNLLISTCIGSIAFLITDISRLTIWGEGMPVSWLPFTCILVLAVPVAQYAGSQLAGYLLGYELHSLKSLGTGRGANMLFFTLMAAGAATMFYVGRERVARAEAEAALERARAETTARQALQAQLQLLQAQIEPHMLFNTLANVQGMITIDPAGAQHMLDQLIHYLRATLSSSRAEATTLGQEFLLMEAYLGLMSVRMGKRLGYTLQLPDALRAAKVPPMLLQPLVENAIMHGLEPKVDGGHVTVSATQAGGMLTLSVADTGLGLGAASAKAGTHLGVSNTRERLHAIYGARAALTLEPGAPHGAVARLTLPVEPT